MVLNKVNKTYHKIDELCETEKYLLCNRKTLHIIGNANLNMKLST